MAIAADQREFDNINYRHEGGVDAPESELISARFGYQSFPF